ncbi:hypothetical protein DIS07_11565 [Polaribacter aquimarinus]|uniref:DUF5673 domain-containing protein n=1 Tax=Polaribacter aquimarinus TaxID=2100726 RepID=A0A2U2J8B4_9FLAO|nr:hypothetical protein DIS07_11565 [Polaribacter aquimarinus]
MKYFTIIISLLIVFVILIFFDNTVVFFFNILIIPFFYLTLFFWEYSIFDKKIDEDFKIRSHKKSFQYYDFIFAVCWTIFIFLGNSTIKYKALFFPILWAPLIVNLVISYLYKKRKPYTLFIKNFELIVINRWTHKRNISGLNKILFDRIYKQFELKFDKGHKIKIGLKEYKKEDINKLLEILIKTSNYSITIPNNYKELENNR